MNSGQDRNDGYVVGVQYPAAFSKDSNPTLIRFVALMHGFGAVDTSGAFASFDLGCGRGFTATLLAAANPQAHFLGNDFNSRHIDSARETAAAADVRNVRFIDGSFAALKGEQVPDLDFISLSGVYSWISAENRQRIIEFVGNRLKCGGFLYLNYMCLPGAGQDAMLSRLLLEWANASPRPFATKIADAVESARRFRDAGARFFRDNTSANLHLDQIEVDDLEYLTHGYLNLACSPFYHNDLAENLEEIGLRYVGSARLMDNFEQLSIKPELRELLAELGGSARETMKDFAVNRAFRRDIFARDARRLTEAQVLELLHQTRFALVRPRSECRLTAETTAGEITMEESVFGPILDWLAAAGPLTLAEICNDLQSTGLDTEGARQALMVLSAARHVQPGLPAAGEEQRAASTQRFNDALLMRVEAGEPVPAWASPVLGSGVVVAAVDQLFLVAHIRGDDPAAYARKFQSHAPPERTRVFFAQKSSEPNLEDQAERFMKERLPVLRHLGIAPE